MLLFIWIGSTVVMDSFNFMIAKSSESVPSDPTRKFGLISAQLSKKRNCYKALDTNKIHSVFVHCMRNWSYLTLTDLPLSSVEGPTRTECGAVGVTQCAAVSTLLGAIRVPARKERVQNFNEMDIHRQSAK